jgi:UDP-N-acetylmuramoylalanine--D-glutamate ligase
MDVAGKRILVVGLARSGVAAARFLAGRGALVVAADRKPAQQLPEEALSLSSLGVALALGPHAPALFEAAELVVVSPGVPWDNRDLVAVRERGVPVLAELELGARFILGGIAAITGTKGKSTTTAALGEMLRAGGGDVRVGGNIGRPVTGLLDGATAATSFVLEASSFQLEGTRDFHPRLAVFTNLSPDHLDRHPSFADYAAAKARIFANQTAEDFAVVNADDPQVLALARAGRARVVRVGERDPGGDDSAFFAEGAAWARLGGERERLFALASVRLPGRHLAFDLLLAATAARLLGASCGDLERTVATFQGIPHVLERVAETRGVVFFNDSKATNVAAARESVLAMDRPTHLILGGRYKGGDFRDLRELAPRLVQVLAIGETRDRIAEALGDRVSVVRCDSLREAVERGFSLAKFGEAVLLAPGCSSFDMFADYAARGDAFRQAVEALRG